MRINNSTFFLFVLLLFSATQTQAITATTKLVSLLKNINTIQGRFTQTIYDKDNNALAISKGIFMLQRPNRFHWQEETPMQQLTIANGKNIWFYQPDLQQVTVVSMFRHNQQTPLAILSGSTDVLNKNYSITQPDSHHFILLSKMNNSAFRCIELVFIGNKIQQMILFDKLGQKTIVDFQQIKLNYAIAADKFQFTIPKNVDVIHR